MACIPAHERILTIEDTAELTVSQPNHVRLLYAKDGHGVAKIGPRELLELSLRMRPDRILLQELRDGTAFYYLRNVNSGHPGSITTVHAELGATRLRAALSSREGVRRKDASSPARTSATFSSSRSTSSSR